MTKNLNKKIGKFGSCASGFVALSASAVLLAQPARSADLGSSCCADLEERIAELESTVARKGNRKVTLTISGQINQGLLLWDDGEEQQLYQVMNSNSSNRVGFRGDAQISPDVRAGYMLELSYRSATSAGVDQFDASNGSQGLQVRNSVVYLDSKSMGALSAGLASPASDDIIGYNLGGTSVAASSEPSRVGGGLFTRDSSFSGEDGLNSLSSGNTISLRWRRFSDSLDSAQANLVRYDTPEWNGFALSASWGADDFWDAAIRYAYESRTVKFAMGAAIFNDSTEDDGTLSWPPGDNEEDGDGNSTVQELKGSASLLHIPTGLFLSGAYVHRSFSGTDIGVLTFACFGSADAGSIRSLGIECTNRPDYEYFWVNGGIKQNLFSLGSTSLYGEYGHSDDGVTGLNVSVRSAAGGDMDYVTSSTFDMWGLGIVQQIRQAHMEVYFSYRNLSADVEGLDSDGTFIDAPIDNTDLFLTGARIRF